MRTIRRLSVLLFLCVSMAVCQPAPQLPYAWENVRIVGGGFISGVIFHPTAPGVRYVRTDMGGAYRSDASADRWQPMLDWVSHADLNLMGVASIAGDPADPDRVYLAC